MPHARSNGAESNKGAAKAGKPKPANGNGVNVKVVCHDVQTKISKGAVRDAESTASQKSEGEQRS